MTRILIVCLGNICRSPLAEGILTEKIEKRNLNVFVNSCGTSTYHIGENPDPRAIATALNHNIDISHLVARQFTVNDFDGFDYIYVMDTYNHAEVIYLARNESDRQKVKLILEVLEPSRYAAEATKSVPDPWEGGDKGFENVYQLLDIACEKIADALNK